MARGQRHSDATRAAVTAALLAGQGVSEVAAAHQIDKGLVSRWRKQLVATGVQQLQPKTRDELESLLMGYVHQNLKTLTTQCEVAGREDYIKKQPASELAVLHGVIADKAFRILSALQPEPEPLVEAAATDNQLERVC